MTPPISIVSKGRWRSRPTSDHLARMGVPHFVVVEEQEAAAYRASVAPCATVVVLDPGYKRDYELCDGLGDSRSTGPGPARNFVWDRAAAAGHKWHWVMDDNIDGFFRYNHNLKTPAVSAGIFRAMEAFADRYENVAMAGPNYFKFVLRRDPRPPFVTNTRIYSCNLIRTGSPYRWRGRYNEDTDLSLRMLKDGWCTVQFNAFLQDKRTTQRTSGGNTAEFYSGEGTMPKSKMIEDLHPDCARVSWRFSRWHHTVDYSRFKTPLRPHGELPPPGVDNFGMRLQQLFGGEWCNVERPTFGERYATGDDDA